MAPQLLLAAALAGPMTEPDTLARPATPDSLITRSTGLEPLDKKPWYRPRHVVLQTGGGIGMVAAGVGYSLGKDKNELDILVGYVPTKYAGSSLTIATAKYTYSPFVLPVGERWQIRPLTVGGYLSYTHGTVNDEEKGQYAKGYYWFSTDTRVGPVLGSRLAYRRRTPAGQPRNVAFYYELGSNDLYILSYVQNRKALSVGDILTLSLGLKADF
ncbi:hypothetical protein [Hymenobacter wooponensis]|uniref:Outer membrane protein beta-barrel domain-containing protein n=1 Tax=Hymenobacter wooponensis TaxID=1525360 RepID=A0A4Z0MDR8_9BACT|nr:hypothetical protein [Hymenobacter wooponensis]TGD77912.1 hypothetical protein EU557_21715 [Hymenobacter wooponensis]